MDTEHPVLLYLRSGLNRGLLIAAVAVAVAGLAFLGPLGRLVVPLAAVLGYLAATVAILQSRSGAAAILMEREEDRIRDTQAAIRAAGAERERIAVLRIAEEAVRKAAEYFLQIAGEYLETCTRLSTHSPRGSDTIREVLSLLQIYQERLDGASTDQEYGIQDEVAAEETRRRGAEETVRRIREAASELRSRMASDLAVLPPQDRLELMDEVEGKE